jgi:hypothetical protein
MELRRRPHPEGDRPGGGPAPTRRRRSTSSRSCAPSASPQARGHPPRPQAHNVMVDAEDRAKVTTSGSPRAGAST